MADQLSNALLVRLKERAQGTNRSDASDLSANSIGAQDMFDSIPKSDDPGVRDYLAGMNSPFAGMIGNLAGGDGSQAKGLLGALGKVMGGRSVMMMGVDGAMVSVGSPGEVPDAAPPATEADIAAAEAQLGFPLPSDLRQFYAEIANGGVGPGGGIYSLAQLAAKHREVTRDPVGPQSQHWPARLLPIAGEDWDLVSIDRDSGGIVYWDLEELDDDDEDEGNVAWDASFIAEAGSLESWLAKWLDAPSQAERMRRERDEALSAKPYTEEELEQLAPEIDEWQRRAAIYSMTPAERAAMGLPEVGWEKKVWEGFDFDKAMKKPRGD